MISMLQDTIQERRLNFQNFLKLKSQKKTHPPLKKDFRTKKKAPVTSM